MAPTTPLPLDVRLMSAVAQCLFGVWLLLVVLGVGWWVVRHPVWALSGISVVGDVQQQNAVTVRAHLASRLHGNFLTLDLQEVQSLMQGVPWVRQAVVQREFPNRLRITLEEHQAVAWWGEAGGGQMVNIQGEVFHANPDHPGADGWTELVGPVGQSQRVHEVYVRLQPLWARIEQQMTRLELDERGSWTAQLQNGAQIKLGRGEVVDLVQRVHQFVLTIGSLAQRFGGRDIESADLRYPDGYALRLRGVTTLEAPLPAPPLAPAAALDTAAPPTPTPQP